MKKQNKLTANLGLKIASLLFAVVLWLVITNINDPLRTLRFYDVPVRMVNTDYVTDNNRMYEVLDNTDVVDVVVTAPRSVIDSLSNDNVTATADFKNITEDNLVPISLACNKYPKNIESIVGDITAVELNIENKMSKNLLIKPLTIGTPEDGYLVGETTIGKNQVKVSGPESIVDKISKAQVTVDVENATNQVSTSAEVKLYNEDDEEIPKQKLTCNINTVDVKVEILSTGKVSFSIITAGEPAEGYLPTGDIEISPSELSVAGKTNIVSELSTIDLGEIDLTGATGDVVKEIALEEFLPDGVSVRDDNLVENITAVAKVERIIAREFTIPNSNIRFINIPEGYAVEVADFEKDTVVELSGLAVNINGLTGADLNPVVDCSALFESEEDWKAGTVNGHLTLNVGDKVKVRQEDKLNILITER